MYLLILVLALSLGGCVEGSTTKPLTPTETQLITQMVTRHLVVPKLTPANKAQVLSGLAAAKLALATSTPEQILANLTTYLGPENADIAALLVVMFKERVDLTTLPQVEGNAYVAAFLTGVEGGLK